MTTQQRMVQALNQADQFCQQGVCILDPALRSLGKVLIEAVSINASTCQDHQIEPLMGSFNYGLHVGYRLAQLEREESYEQEN